MRLDLSKGSEMYDDLLVDIFRRHDIGILINNAGIMYDYPDFVHRLTDEVRIQ